MDATKVISQAKGHYSPSELERLKKAIDLASQAHEGQKRKSKDPYITHPLTVASTLIDWQMDIDSVITGVLHDTIEDTTITIKDIADNFGPNVAFLVDGVTKVSKARAGMKELSEYLPQTTDNLSKLLVAVGQDIRVIIIKLADRLHNLNTLKYLSREKQIKIARESLEVFSPMADRIGMGRVRVQIEDLAFSFLNPREYKKIFFLIRKRLGKSARKLGIIHGEVEKLLKKEGVSFTMHGRIKGVHSLYQKLKKTGNDIDAIYDLIALRIIVESKEDCYRTLGLIHSIYQPMVKRIKDYIAAPKPNGYQSLHTTVITPTKQIVEFQIRTKEMHEYAESGLAASFHYHEQKKSKNYTKNISSAPLPSNLQWITQLQEIASHLKDGEEISQKQLNIDLFKNRIFVYSPKGDIFNLPEGALPLDFAYAVHTDLGHQAVGFRVNGQIHPFDRPLENGDIIEVLTRKTSRPKPDWINLVITTGARNKLKAKLKLDL